MARQEIEAYRRERDRIFREGLTSPLTARQKAAFDGLTYYDDDPALDFEVEVVRVEALECVTIETTKHETRVFERWGRFTVVVDGREQQLTLYKAPFGFFVPFIDANAGVETYPAGRYVDPVEVGDGRFRVDFNRAYNPLCAYNEQWSCPITPEENRLDVAIRAGERLPRGEWVKLR